MKPFQLPDRLIKARRFFESLHHQDESAIRARFLLDELELCHRSLWRVGLEPLDEFKFPSESAVLDALMFSALHECAGCQTNAARLLGISRNSLWYRSRHPRKPA